MGEAEFKPNGMSVAVNEAVAEMAAIPETEMRLVTPGGRYQVRRDEGGSATALGQLPFFAEFLEVSGLFERWVKDCPMAYTSPNAPETRDVLGTRGVAGVAAGAMSRLYRLMAEGAESGVGGNFLQVVVVTGRRLPDATKPWRGFLRDGVVEHVTERSKSIRRRSITCIAIHMRLSP